MNMIFAILFDEKTIIYTQDPETIMTMNADGSNRRKVEGINSYQVKYNAAAGKLVYVNTETDNNVMVYDWKKKTSTVILDGTKMIDRF